MADGEQWEEEIVEEESGSIPTNAPPQPRPSVSSAALLSMPSKTATPPKPLNAHPFLSQLAPRPTLPTLAPSGGIAMRNPLLATLPKPPPLNALYVQNLAQTLANPVSSSALLNAPINPLLNSGSNHFLNTARLSNELRQGLVQSHHQSMANNLMSALSNVDLSHPATAQSETKKPKKPRAPKVTPAGKNALGDSFTSDAQIISDKGQEASDGVTLNNLSLSTNLNIDPAAEKDKEGKEKKEKKRKRSGDAEGAEGKTESEKARPKKKAKKEETIERGDPIKSTEAKEEVKTDPVAEVKEEPREETKEERRKRKEEKRKRKEEHEKRRADKEKRRAEKEKLKAEASGKDDIKPEEKDKDKEKEKDKEKDKERIKDKTRAKVKLETDDKEKVKEDSQKTEGKGEQEAKTKLPNRSVQWNLRDKAAFARALIRCGPNKLQWVSVIVQKSEKQIAEFIDSQGGLDGEFIKPLLTERKREITDVDCRLKDERGLDNFSPFLTMMDKRYVGLNLFPPLVQMMTPVAPKETPAPKNSDEVMKRASLIIAANKRGLNEGEEKDLQKIKDMLRAAKAASEQRQAEAKSKPPPTPKPQPAMSHPEPDEVREAPVKRTVSDEPPKRRTKFILSGQKPKEVARPPAPPVLRPRIAPEPVKETLTDDDDISIHVDD